MLHVETVREGERKKEIGLDGKWRKNNEKWQFLFFKRHLKMNALKKYRSKLLVGKLIFTQIPFKDEYMKGGETKDAINTRRSS